MPFSERLPLQVAIWHGLARPGEGKVIARAVHGARKAQQGAAGKEQKGKAQRGGGRRRHGALHRDPPFGRFALIANHLFFPASTAFNVHSRRKTSIRAETIAFSVLIMLD